MEATFMGDPSGDMMTIEISLPPTSLVLRPFCAFVSELASIYPAFRGNADFLFDLRLLIDEAFMNACEHGNRTSGARQIEVSIMLTKDQVELSIMNYGAEIQVDELDGDRLDLLDEGGRGLMIIRELSDEFAYKRDDLGRNVFKLLKRLDHVKKENSHADAKK